MSRVEWERIYKLAWQSYYTLPHIETVLRRAAATQANVANALFLITWFKASIEFEKIHPLETGLLRMKFRRDRRPTLPLEPAWYFYPRYITESVVKMARWIALYVRLRRIYARIKHAPDRFQYLDTAMLPVVEDEVETHELFQSDAARAYVGEQQRLEKIRHNSMA